MSGDFHGPLSEFAKAFAQHSNLPPPQKAFARTSYGSLLLCACAYTAYELGPDAPNQYPPAALYGFCAALGLGLLLFVAGLRGPRLAVDLGMTRFWSLCAAVAFAAGSWWLAVHQPDWWDNLWVRVFCLSFTCAQGLEFLLLLRPMSSNARGMVEDNIAETEFNWD